MPAKPSIKPDLVSSVTEELQHYRLDPRRVVALAEELARLSVFLVEQRAIIEFDDEPGRFFAIREENRTAPKKAKPARTQPKRTRP